MGGLLSEWWQTMEDAADEKLAQRALIEKCANDLHASQGCNSAKTCNNYLCNVTLCTLLQYHTSQWKSLFSTELQSCFGAIFIICKVAALPTRPDFYHYVESYNKIQWTGSNFLQGLTTVTGDNCECQEQFFSSLKWSIIKYYFWYDHIPNSQLWQIVLKMRYNQF